MTGAASLTGVRGIAPLRLLRRRPPLDGEPSTDAAATSGAAAGTVGAAVTGAAAGARAGARAAGLADSTGKAAAAAAGPINSASSASFGDCGMTRPLPRLLLFPGDLLAFVGDLGDFGPGDFGPVAWRGGGFLTEDIWAAASPNLARIKFCVEIDVGAEGGREPKAPLNAADKEGTIGALCFAPKLNCWEAFEVTGPLCFTMAGSCR